MGRSACCDKVGLKKGPWTPEEDQKLRTFIEEHGHGSWRSLPSKAGLQRCGKSCRLRWTNYLRPDIKRGKFSLQEDQSIIQLHALLGNRWSAIAAHLPTRTDNEIKNYWNTHLKKRLTKMGIDPVTHKPKTNAFGSVQSKDAANISHMAQWESARLEAETRLVRESKLLYSSRRYQLSQIDSLSSPTNHQLFNNKICTPKMPPCLDVLKAWQGAWATTRDSHHDENNATLLRSLFNSNGTLESPTSTLNFSENMMLNIPTFEFTEDVQNNWNQEMVLRELAYPTLDDASYNLDTLRLPSIMENLSDAQVSGNKDNANSLSSSSIEPHGNVDGIGNGGDDFKEKKNDWDDMLNLVALQSGSPVF